MYNLEFELNFLPKLGNQIIGKNRYLVHSHRNECHLRVRQAIGANLPPKPLKRAKLVLTRFSSKAPDADGLCISFKFIIDALVQSQVLENDQWENIGMPEYAWVKSKPKEGKISVRIKEIN